MLETAKESLECLKINEIEVYLGKKLMLKCSSRIRDEKIALEKWSCFVQMEKRGAGRLCTSIK